MIMQAKQSEGSGLTARFSHRSFDESFPFVYTGSSEGYKAGSLDLYKPHYTMRLLSHSLSTPMSHRS